MPPFDWYDLEFLLKVLSGQILPIQLFEWGNWSFLASFESRRNTDYPKDLTNLNTKEDKQKNAFGGGLLLQNVFFRPYPGAAKRKLFNSVCQPFSWSAYPEVGGFPGSKAFIFKDGINPPAQNGAAYIPINLDMQNTDGPGLTGEKGTYDANKVLTDLEENGFGAINFFKHTYSAKDMVLGANANPAQVDPEADDFYPRLDPSGVMQIEIDCGFQINNYQYRQVYRFYADGRIECGVVLQGKLNYLLSKIPHLHSLMFRFEIPQPLDESGKKPTKVPMVVAALQKEVGQNSEQYPKFGWHRKYEPQGLMTKSLYGLRVMDAKWWSPNVVDPAFETMDNQYPVNAIEFQPSDTVQYEILGKNTDPITKEFWVNSIWNETVDFSAPGPWQLARKADGAEKAGVNNPLKFHATDKIFLPTGQGTYEFDDSGVVVWYALRHLHIPNPDEYPIMPPEPLFFVVRSVGTDPPKQKILT